ncbi:uncharacterized protein MELLADRAFT_32569 [Melampsora larici-populina 98AG31]|uniref:Uncharacterized protein n=1 Tax=Melampsora larici-populina (strain 98AG31 / pathotype 3-4-7) TaxID=747676 RepID=F4R3P1_MELLP|nr:uncharacterized protein MELLADRAFT_32569 [Melampsora larici-populina 98AG31]EGG13134.1 hypothetical protein MELLADRAFT_32569 [Melampsora larici-populina 98AG31]
MAQTHFLPIPNTDLISSFNFNYHGNRIAVSSLDHHLYVLSSDPETGNWPQDIQQEEDQLIKNKKHLKSLPNLQSWTAHEGPILKVVWSEPPHDELLASSGTDGTIRIWEERCTEPSSEPITQWRQQAILADSYGHVRDLAFSPSETSLKLASISTDHHLRLYECLESNSITSDSWNMIIDLDLSVLPPTLCSSSSGGWSLTWCPETYWGDILAVSAAVKSTGTESNPNLQTQTSHQFSKPAPVSSLAWSPACARDYHLIAAGHRDGRARIWKLKPSSLNSLPSNQSSMHWQVELDTELEDHVIKKPLKEVGSDGDNSGGGGVGKCEWNVTGTVLSTSGSDGKVRIWKSKLIELHSDLLDGLG